MSIKTQVDDAAFLEENGRYTGALSLLLLAVAASARKVYPKGKMSDHEAFVRFLSGRLATVLNGANPPRREGGSVVAVSVPFKGAQLDLAEILYSEYRCNLVHEAELPDGIYFTSDSEIVSFIDIRNGEAGIRMCIQNDMLTFGYSMIGLLKEVVSGARCNGSLFGRKHYILESQIDDESFINANMEAPRFTVGGFSYLKRVVEKVGPETLSVADDEQLQAMFMERVEAGDVNRGVFPMYYECGVSDRGGQLSSKGIDLLRKTAGEFHRVDITDKPDIALGEV